MHCINCGRALPEHARFCADCGAPADQETTRLAAPPASPPSSAPPRPPATTSRQRQQDSYFSAPPQPARPLSDLRERSGHAATAGDADAEERVIFTVRPTLLFVGAGYAAAALGAVLLVVLLSLLDVSPLFSVPPALALLLVPAFYHLRRSLVRYTLTDSKIIIDRGLVSRTTSNIPLRNVQSVTVSASFMQRLLRFGDVVIDDANAQAPAVVLDDIPDPRRHADLLLRELRRWR